MASNEKRMRGAAALVVGAAWHAVAFAQAAGDEQPSVTPYRPGVATPAELSAPGWLEAEAGLLHAHPQGVARRDSLPYSLKLAFTPDWGVRIEGDAWARQVDDSGQDSSGVGDTSVVLKRRFAITAASAFGLEAGATFPTARHGLGVGKSDYSVNGIYSSDFPGDYHIDINLVGTRIGDVDPGSSRGQVLGAASLSKSLTERWGVAGEFSGTHQNGAGSTAQFLGAFTYNVSKSLVLDAGMTRSIHSGPSEWSAFTGFTMLLGRLF